MLRTAFIAAVIASIVVGHASASTLARPQILAELKSLEVCVRTMCLPSGDAGMSIGYAKTVLDKLAQQPNALDRWVTQRLNAAVQLLQQKKIREGLETLQAAIRELPAA